MPNINNDDPRLPHAHRYELIWPDGYERKFHGCRICGTPNAGEHPCAIKDQCAAAQKRAASIMGGIVDMWLRQNPAAQTPWIKTGRE